MGETILAWIIISVALLLLAYATLGRLWRLHRPMRWRGGGQVSFVGELSLGIFALCLGLAVLHQSAAWCIPVVTAWCVGFASQHRARRRLELREKALRETNAANYPGIFDSQAPVDIDSVGGDHLDLYDAEACCYLGRVSRRDLKELIRRFETVPDQGPNDIFVLPEALGLLPEGSVSQEFMSLLEKAFEERESLVLRWMPARSRA